jgi:hypothetical protein
VAASSGSARGGLTAVASFLRVYEPLEAFPADERAWWRAVAANGPLTASQMAAREHAAALRALAALPPRVVTDLDLTDGVSQPVGIILAPEAADGRLRVCPIEMSWRSLLALEEFQTDIVPSVLPAFLPASVVDTASASLTSLVSERSSLTGPHVRSCRWSVPLSWLAVFQPSHRHVESQGSAAHPPAASGHQETEADAERLRPSVQPAPSSRYLAPMADARRCVARALASVRVADTLLLPLAELEELGRWLEEFHARSYVELDYGGLGPGLVTRAGPSAAGTDGPVGTAAGFSGSAGSAGTLGSGGAGETGEDEAVEDSVAEVSRGLGELRAGNVEAGVSRLSLVRDRWDEIRAHEHAS